MTCSITCLKAECVIARKFKKVPSGPEEEWEDHKEPADWQRQSKARVNTVVSFSFFLDVCLCFSGAPEEAY